MNQPTYEANVIKSSDFQGNPQLAAAIDSCAKRLLSSKQIVARIMQAVVSEYENCDIDEILPLIGTVAVSGETVDSENVMPVIVNEDTEDNSINEGKRVYDIKFTARTPDNETIALIINIELQNNFNAGYPLIKRAVYYAARMISSQYGTVFRKSDYDKIRKVYSIWICTSPDEKNRGTISSYGLSHKALLGDVKDTKRDVLDYDLINIVMICLGDTDTKECRGIIRMLRTLFSKKYSYLYKKDVMENEYGIPMTEEISKEVEDMCNISSMYYNDGINEGMEKGIAMGMEKGAMNEKRAFIKNLWGQSIPVDVIAKAAQLPESEIRKIIEESQN
jgi:hypothetical protein